MYRPEYENALNVSLNVSEAERKKSQILSTGYSEETGIWELLVRYSRYPEKFLEQYPEVVFIPMTGNYGLVRISQELISQLADQPEIIYMEIPKRLYLEEASSWKIQQISSEPVDSLQVSGIPRLKEQLGMNLTGKGVLIGIADSGIDVFHPAFRNPDGTTRILHLWDQASNMVYDRADINTWLLPESERLNTSVREQIPLAFRDLSGHGTAVAGIAAGSLVADGNFVTQGYAPEAELVVVRLNRNSPDNDVKTTQLIQAVDFLAGTAAETGMPMALNLSIGNNYGSHTGSSLLSTYLSEIALQERVTICVGSGNEAGRPIHSSVRLSDQPYEILLPVSQRQVSFNLQLWKSYADIFEIELITPWGDIFSVTQGDLLFLENAPVQQYQSRNTQLILYNGVPTPYQPLQEIFFDFLPINQFVDSGNWRIRLTPVRIVTGICELWLPAGGTLNAGTGFAVPDQEHTLTVPSAADRVITVGAYDSNRQTYASFSGRGFTAFTNLVKPDLAAPGVNVLAPRTGIAERNIQPGTSESNSLIIPSRVAEPTITVQNARTLYTGFTGTSFAAPAVTGAAALLMQWGIVEQRDLWLYGSKLKSWFHRNARDLRAFDVYPNPYVGYGVL